MGCSDKEEDEQEGKEGIKEQSQMEGGDKETAKTQKINKTVRFHRSHTSCPQQIQQASR